MLTFPRISFSAQPAVVQVLVPFLTPLERSIIHRSGIKIFRPTLAIAIIDCKQSNNKMQLNQVIEQGSAAQKGCWWLRSVYYTSNCGMELLVTRRSLSQYPELTNHQGLTALPGKQTMHRREQSFQG
jgi:hypothetical protein